MIVGVVLSLGLLALTHANDDAVRLDAGKDQHPAGTTYDPLISPLLLQLFVSVILLPNLSGSYGKL